MTSELDMEHDRGIAELVACLDALADTADAAASQSGLGFWAMRADGDVYCEGHEDDPEWRVAQVPDDHGNQDVAKHIAQNDPATVLAVTEALRRVAAACREADVERGMRLVRRAIAQAATDLASARGRADVASPGDNATATRR